MRSAPTLKSWMMPFSSVAMIEKLGLVRIAYCKDRALTNDPWRRATVASSILPAAATRVKPFSISGMVDGHRPVEHRLYGTVRGCRQLRCARLDSSAHRSWRALSDALQCAPAD